VTPIANKPPHAVRKREESEITQARSDDRRVIRTKRALGAALVELMLAEKFDAITVQRVLERAKVGRTTFYAHYRNTDDLLLSDVERFFGMLETHFEKPGIAGRRVAPVAELLQHMRDVREFQRALERSGKREVVYELFAGYLAKMIARRIAALVPDADALSVPIPVAARMFAGALVELLRWSLNRDSTHSPAWVDARYHEIVWLGLGGAQQ
jgi:AcrR family transcriptional regulator